MIIFIKNYKYILYNIILYSSDEWCLYRLRTTTTYSLLMTSAYLGLMTRVDRYKFQSVISSWRSYTCRNHICKKIECVKNTVSKTNSLKKLTCRNIERIIFYIKRTIRGLLVCGQEMWKIEKSREGLGQWWLTPKWLGARRRKRKRGYLHKNLYENGLLICEMCTHRCNLCDNLPTKSILCDRTIIIQYFDVN